MPRLLTVALLSAAVPALASAAPDSNAPSPNTATPGLTSFGAEGRALASGDNLFRLPAAGTPVGSSAGVSGADAGGKGVDAVNCAVPTVPEPGAIGLGVSAAVTALAGWRTRRRWAV